MEYLIGIPFFAFGGWLMWSALERRRKVGMTVAEARAAGLAPPARNPSLELMGDALPPLIIFVLCIFGLKTSLLYFVFAHNYIAFIDLLGFLFMLGSYGFWLMTMTKYREMRVLAPDTAGGARGSDGADVAVAGGVAAPVGPGDGVRDLAAEVAASAEGGARGTQAA